MSGWLKISTAPRDGEWVLLYSPDAIDERPFTGQWREDPEYPDGGAWWPDLETGFHIDADPSHWMPLPVAPA